MDSGPVFGKNCAAEFVPLAKGNGSHSSPFKAEGKAPDAREQVKDIQSSDSSGTPSLLLMRRSVAMFGALCPFIHRDT